MQRLPAIGGNTNRARSVTAGNSSSAHNKSGAGTRQVQSAGGAAGGNTTATSPTKKLINTKIRTMPIIVHYIIRPHLAPCFTDVAIVPVEARCEDITLCAANTLFAHCDAYGAVLGQLPSTQISDYGLYLLKPRNMRSVEANRVAAACECIDNAGLRGEYDDDGDDGMDGYTEVMGNGGPHELGFDVFGGGGAHGGGMGFNIDITNDAGTTVDSGTMVTGGGSCGISSAGGGGGGPAPTYDTARRPTVAVHGADTSQGQSLPYPSSTGTLIDAPIPPPTGVYSSDAFESPFANKNRYNNSNNNRHSSVFPLGSSYNTNGGQQQGMLGNTMMTAGGGPALMGAGNSSSVNSYANNSDGNYHAADHNANAGPKLVTLPPIPPHPSHNYLAYERTELGILEEDFDACHARAMMVRFVQTVMEKRAAGEDGSNGGGGGLASGFGAGGGDDDDPTILAAKVRARVDALYQYNRNAAEDADQREREVAAVAAHLAIAAQLRPPEVYFCLTSDFLSREECIADEEEQRGAIEVIWENSWEKLQSYARLWKGRSIAAQQFRETNATSRNHMQACESKVREKLLAKEANAWQTRIVEFRERFAALEFGMLAQFHHMRALRAKHRGEIDSRLVVGGGGSSTSEAASPSSAATSTL